MSTTTSRLTFEMPAAGTVRALPHEFQPVALCAAYTLPVGSWGVVRWDSRDDIPSLITTGRITLPQADKSARRERADGTYVVRHSAESVTVWKRFVHPEQLIGTLPARTHQADRAHDAWDEKWARTLSAVTAGAVDDEHLKMVAEAWARVNELQDGSSLQSLARSVFERAPAGSRAYVEAYVCVVAEHMPEHAHSHHRREGLHLRGDQVDPHVRELAESLAARYRNG
jgi:hypothetical protein